MNKYKADQSVGIETPEDLKALHDFCSFVAFERYNLNLPAEKISSVCSSETTNAPAAGTTIAQSNNNSLSSNNPNVLH